MSAIEKYLDFLKYNDVYYEDRGDIYLKFLHEEILDDYFNEQFEKAPKFEDIKPFDYSTRIIHIQYKRIKENEIV